jgi:glutamate synthase (ferredoxin)
MSIAPSKDRAKPPAGRVHGSNRRVRAPGAQGLYDPRFEHDACGVGFVVDIQGRRSHRILEQALQVLKNLDHRGACGAETNTGDGAGVLIQMPHAFNEEVGRKARFTLPAPGEYGSGIIFLPRNPTVRRLIEERFEQVVQAEGQQVLGWRTVQVANGMLGETARSCEPFMRQVFIRRNPAITDELDFERKLYVIRKRAYNEIRTSTMAGAEYWYVVSLSSRTIVFKGMLLTGQLDQYFLDLKNPAIETALALVHSRFSTNTFPSWDRAHPYRYLAHNGEINTVRGNANWMHAREARFESDAFGADIADIRPIINPNGSDSGMFDNTLELLMLAGRSLPHAMMMMIPEPWSNHEGMDDRKRAFYQYHSSLMEPWDGPASIAFTDGRLIGAVLDRNGLRPSRYYVTKDDLVVMASEAGVLDLPPQDVVLKGRLQPGRMFLVDTVQGRIIDDEEIKRTVAADRPYREWLDEYLVHLEDLPPAPEGPAPDPDSLLQRQVAFGYSFEEERMLLAPMARDGVEAVGSMGNDAPLAVLSNRPRLLYDYFKQLFAQVTNPPIDCIREELITSAETRLGSEGNLLNPQPSDCRRLELKWPILSNDEFAKVRRMDLPGLRVGVLPILFRVTRGEKGLVKSMEELRLMARRLIEEEEVNVIVLSDRGVNREFAPIPSLMAVAGLHHYLIREGLRTRASLVIETGDAREVHHFALLIGYGVSAINPWLTFETLDRMIDDGLLPGVDHRTACRNFVKAASKGVIKVASKMGISSLQSYRGAQVFEAVGLRQDVIDEYFSWTASRVGGIGTDVIAQEVLMRHGAAFSERAADRSALPSGGQYQWRANSEHHLFNPESIHRLQKAVRNGSYASFKEYSRIIDGNTAALCTLRGLLELKPADPVPLEEVEPVESIVKRFKTGAMSYGSISKEAHETLAIAMNRIGGRSNTGEGGEDPDRYVRLPERRLEELGDQAGRVRAFRRNERIPGQREGAADQDGAGREARRRRPAPGHQGLPLDRPHQAHHRGCWPHLAAAAPRHLLHRGPRGAHPRPEEREPRGADQRQARRGSRRRDHRGRRGEGARRRRADQRPRRWHRRFAADLDRARGAAVGARPRGDAPDAGPQQPAQPHCGRDRRTAQDRPRRSGGGAARCRGIRLRNRAAGRDRLHHDAGLPPEHLPRRRRHAGSAAAREVHGPAGARGQLHALHRAGDA